MSTSHVDPPSSTAVLLGNGLSIAANRELSIPSITAEIVERLDRAGVTDDPASVLMQEVATRLRVTNASDNFEALVGPFDEIADATKMMDRLAGLAGDRKLDIQGALRESSAFASNVRRHAVSHVLDVISTRSRAEWDRIGPVAAFLDAAVDSASGGEVTFGNLNYDSMAMAALITSQHRQLCDLTDGRLGQQRVEVVPGHEIAGRTLRQTADLPIGRRISLLHLHGSLAWLHNPSTGQSMRFAVNDLRRVDYWRAWREGLTTWEPLVVLTNQNSKNALIKDYPFSLAYKTFEERLFTADRWIVAGASLGDDCLNEVLRRVWARRSTLPSVMVVTKGNDPSEKHITDALGFDPVWGNDPDPSLWLTICRDGIEQAPTSLEWVAWTTATPPKRQPAA